MSSTKIDLTTFFLSVSSTAFIALESEGQIDLDEARQNIEILELMEEKTAGNRSDQENQLIERLLYEVRIKYVEAEKRVK